MLANKDLYDELEQCETLITELKKNGKVFEATMLKTQVLILKLLHSLRTNSVALMKAHGVKLVESQRRPDADDSKTDDSKTEVKK